MVLLIIIVAFMLGRAEVKHCALTVKDGGRTAELSKIGMEFCRVTTCMVYKFFTKLTSVTCSTVFTAIRPKDNTKFRLRTVNKTVVNNMSVANNMKDVAKALFNMFIVYLLGANLPFVKLATG